MLRPRITPCLLLHEGGLTKTIRFGEGKYVGDPLNAIRIFNEKEADEIIVADIDATPSGSEPNFDLIERMSNECRMPMCYAGGITRVDQIERIISLGVEKVAVGSSYIDNPLLIPEAIKRVGRQSIVGVVNVKKTGLLRKYTAMTHRGHKKIHLDLIDLIQELETQGVGEVLLQSIDNDGMMQGYDHHLIKLVKERIRVPLTVLGGAGNFLHIKSLFDEFGVVGAAAGSLFVYKGKYKAVLINYPSYQEKKGYGLLR